MALCIYITRECEDDAKRHNRYDELIKLKERVEKAQRICHFDNFPPPYLKKRFDRQIRLIADFRTVSCGGDDHVAVCFLRVFVRSSNDYARFLSDSRGFGKKNLAPLVDDGDLQEFVAGELREHPPKPKPKPSAPEHEFLYRFLGQDAARGADEFVCESELWVRGVAEEKPSQMLLLICDTLANCFGTDATTVPVRSMTIVCRWFEGARKLFLAGLAGSDHEIAEINAQYEHLLTAPEAEIAEDEILRCSVRTYPSLILADDGHWADIEKDKESNLALSSEETRVLESVHAHDEGFPIFINGRAGSGKSTILYYLFADYVTLYSELVKEHPELCPPILFSCSPDLTDRASRTVLGLLGCNPLWREDSSRTPELPEGSFQEFHGFLYRLLPPDIQEEYEESRFIDYARFRRMWEEQFGHEPSMRKKAGPDMSWHVIRSYIRGMSVDVEDELEPADYQELPRRQKSVTREAFEAVHERVYQNWYAELCHRDGYWDDQDLVRRVIQEDLVQPVYPAVFCDEAQDFTRVELDVLFRLCLFGNRKMGHKDVSRVPFAFAGDPFQTLNPTGFRWDAVQALFHEKLTDTVGDNVHGSIDLNYHELSLNYRSTKHIVRLCNFIQGFRTAVFGLSNVSPQGTWQTEINTPMPVWFDRENLSLWEQIRQEGDLTVIVPCPLNDEAEFVRNADGLKELVEFDENGVPVNIRVFSPARAKGLEFDRVVLFGFADELPASATDILTKAPGFSDDLLPLEYYVNQLYVAASRPKRRLFIIDRKQSRDAFWALPTDETRCGSLLERIGGDVQAWRHAIGGVQIGTPESWHEERGDPEENAKRIEEQGHRLHDPFMLRSAAGAYENLSMVPRARFCRAYALQFENKHLEAGNGFWDAGDASQALRCYWHNAGDAAARKKMAELARAFPEIGAQIEVRLAQTAQNGSPEAILENLRTLLQRVDDTTEFLTRLASESGFASIVWVYTKYFLEESAEKGELRQLKPLVAGLVQKGLRRNSRLLARLHHELGEYSEALREWQRLTDYASDPDYRKTEIALQAEHFRHTPSIALTGAESAVLAELFFERGEWGLALRALRRGASLKDAVATLKRLPETEWTRANLLNVFGALADCGQWQQLLGLAKGAAGLDNNVRLPSKLRKRLGKHAEAMHEAAVGTLALAADLPNQPSDVLRNCSDYLKAVLLNDGSWRRSLSVQASGAALEGAGRQIDILPFYERVFKDESSTRHEALFARKRWIVTKEKQATRDEENGKQAQARRRMEEADAMRRETGLVDVQLDELPVISEAGLWVPEALPSASPDAESSENHTLTIGGGEPSPTPTPSGTGEILNAEPADPAAHVEDESGGPVTPPPARNEPTAPERATGVEEREAGAEEGSLLGEVPADSTSEELQSTDPPIPEQPERVEFGIGDLRFEFASAIGRLNITHRETMDVATIRADSRCLASTDVEIVEDGGVYVCEEWGCSCDFSRQDDTGEVRLDLGPLGLAISFRLEYANGVRRS
jgi:hypothetical protein